MKKIIFLVLVPVIIHAQTNPSLEASRQWVDAKGPEILAEFAELLTFPNHASDSVNIRKNASKLNEIFSARGFEMQILEVPGAPPVVYGEHLVENATRTLCFYIHYDGQPVDPDAWTHDPFKPVLYDNAMFNGGKPIAFPKSGDPIDEEWRIYARSASDDKAPIAALMAAIDALQTAGIGYTSNIKLFFDGEEESSSPNVITYLKEYHLLFDDITLWLMCDGAVFQTGAPQLKFGGRGVTGMEIMVYGANKPLHSGHYGNWAPVPGQMLARLLTSMKAEDGKVLIDGFYDTTEPISEFEREMLNNTPDIDERLKKELGLVFTAGNGQSINERLLLPSLTVRGLSSGNVGAKSRNIIPSTATATLGIRMVKGNDPEHMLDLVEAHIQKEGWHIVYDDPDPDTRLKYPKIVMVKRTGHGFPAAKFPMEEPEVLEVIQAVRGFVGEELVLLPSSGGSNNIFGVIADVLQKPAIGVNMVNHDNNQHAADENVRIGNLWYGVDLMAVLLTMPERGVELEQK